MVEKMAAREQAGQSRGKTSDNTVQCAAQRMVVKSHLARLTDEHLLPWLKHVDRKRGLESNPKDVETSAELITTFEKEVRVRFASPNSLPFPGPSCDSAAALRRLMAPVHRTEALKDDMYEDAGS